MVDAPSILPHYTVRFLAAVDVSTIQGLVERCADYVWLAAGQAPQLSDGEKLLIDRPPDKSLDNIHITLQRDLGGDL